MLFRSMIMVFDIAHLGHLILNVDGGWFAGAIFTILTANVFAAVQVGVSVMRDIDSDEPPAGSGGPGARQHVAIPEIGRASCRERV